MKRETASPPVIGIAGWKKSGKTTLAARLIAEFTKRGLKVASIKHAHHGFQIDDAETDSARHRRAGASPVAIVSRKRWALVKELSADEPEPDLAQVIAWLGPCDLVVVEGYKSAAIPKIEARRRDARGHEPLAQRDADVIAIAADYDVGRAGPPAFALDDIAALADFIARTLALPQGRAAAAAKLDRSVES
jgi:molybdopterin-guanine dinucleotide biosynthesis protein B